MGIGDMTAPEQAGLVQRLGRYQEVLGRALESLLEQHEELGRYQGDLQEALDSRSAPASEETASLQEEIRRLRQDRDGLEEQAIIMNRRVQTAEAELEKVAQLDDEIVRLREALAVQEVEMAEQANRRPVRVGSEADDGEVADYEAELNEFRRQLEADRQVMDDELAKLRSRNKELNDAARDAELHMSRERAQLARERAQLDRLRDEIRSEMDRALRDAGINDSLAPLQKLKDELAVRRNGGSDSGNTPVDRERPPQTSRWRSFLAGSTTPRG